MQHVSCIVPRSVLDPEDLLVLILEASANCHRINGRTTLQKISYFTSYELKLNNGFFPHYFGPYSHVIATALGQLVSLGLVKEESSITNNERKMYSYSLTDDGKIYASNLAKRYKTKFNKVKKIVTSVEKIEGDRINRISSAAKVHYLAAHSQERLTLQSAIEQAKAVGWNLEEKQIIGGATTLFKMKHKG